MQRYYKPAVDKFGSVRAGGAVQISVFTGVISTTLASIFDSTSLASKNNPFPTDSDGYIDFVAADGVYHIEARDQQGALIGKDRFQLFDQADALRPAQNLNDLPDKSQARINLGVPSTQSINDAVAAAQNAKTAAEAAAAVALAAVSEPLVTMITDATASRVLVSGDANKYIRMTIGSPNTVVVSPDSTLVLPVNSKISGIAAGAGQTTLTPGAGVTINATPGTKTRARFSPWTLYKVGANVWDAFGDLSA